MKLLVKIVPKCKHNHRGEFLVRDAHKCEIQISADKNKDVSDFAATLLHELLHFWVTILQTHGLKESIRREHKFIDRVVPYLLTKLAFYFK